LIGEHLFFLICMIGLKLFNNISYSGILIESKFDIHFAIKYKI